MKTEIPVAECHRVLLDIAKEIHDICVNYDIPYYMLGGTQLGAVRHNGIIPWDDDMDFGVPREHFQRLKDLLESELGTPYRVISLENTNDYYAGFIKIEDTRTIVELKEQSDFLCGINIDIFPLDRTNGSLGLFSKNNLIINLYKIHNYRFLDIDSGSQIKRMISKLLKICLPFLKKDTILKFIEKKLLKSQGEYIANYYGAWGLKEIVRADYFGAPMLYDFEDCQFYGVQDSDKYLTSLYGDYMQLPPENKRHTHINKAYYK